MNAGPNQPDQLNLTDLRDGDETFISPNERARDKKSTSQTVEVKT